MDERKNTFWVFVIIVLFVSAVGGCFSWYLRTRAVEEVRHADAALKEFQENDRLLEDPLLRRWFLRRFDEAWQESHESAPPDQARQQAIKAFRARVRALPSELVKKSGK